MAKDNLFLGTARGSVGDVTFSRLNGVQVARVRNRAPRNPQSPAQMLQRVIMSSVGKAYSFMQNICNHSFENFELGQMSQRKFMEVNVGILRDKAGDVIAYPIEAMIKASTAHNYSFKNDYLPVVNRYMISAGSLPSIPLMQGDSGVSSTIPFNTSEITQATVTYQQMVDAMGLQKGDQLTFIQVTNDATLEGHDADLMTGFRYARIIMEPSDGDMSSTFFAESGINKPNERNEGSFTTFGLVTTEGQQGLYFLLHDVVTTPSSDKHLAASAVILSRLDGNKWRRSQQFLEPRFTSGGEVLKASTLGLAYETYLTQPSSDLYLNQAE